MGDGGCRVCGRVPAARLVLRRHVGMLILQKFYKLDAPLCRDHGRELAKDYLGKTLLLGWWGVISFFVNFFAVFTDVRALITASSLDPPRPPIEEGEQPSDSEAAGTAGQGNG